MLRHPTEAFACAVAGAAAAALFFYLREQRSKVKGVSAPPESTIRLMTRLAIQHNAVNLSQGFPNEPPPREMVLAAAGALIAGASIESAQACAQKLASLLPPAAEDALDSMNQYHFPFGMPILRKAIQDYYADFYPGVPADADVNLTVCLGATEGFAICLRALTAPGDAVVFFQPFHELYPNQCTIFGLVPKAVTLFEDSRGAGGWTFSDAELDSALSGASLLLFNSPHNPTGKVFTAAELQRVSDACIRHNVLVVTDEIYEHMTFDRATHTSVAQLPGMAERTCIVNALSKTARATGWRVGWVVAPARFTPTIRAVHDQLVLQAPTPLQVGAAAMLSMGRAHFEAIADEYLPKRELLLDALRRAGFSIGATPQGAYYLFVGYRSVPALAALNPTEAAMKMTTEYKVACVPGDNFYLGAAARADPERGGRYLRFTFVRSLETLRAAAVKLRALEAAS